MIKLKQNLRKTLLFERLARTSRLATLASKNKNVDPELSQSGQILILVFVALGVVLFTVLFIISGAQLYFQNALYSANAEQATALAEAGIDKALNSLNRTGGIYNGEAETFLGDGSYSVTITSTDASTKLIQSTGYIPNKTKAKVKRTIKITASRGVGVAFVYGVQVGEGGLQLGNSNEIHGSVYSNGNIAGGNNNSVTGDIWVAGGPKGTPDQQTDCTDVNCQDFVFGKVVNGNSQLDIAQSFQATSSGALNKVSLKLYKSGNPADVTVRITGDDKGIPDKNNVLATGTLYSSLATSNYGWVDVTFDTTPNLTANTTYWLLVDTSSDNNNYWSWQNDLAQSYNRGLPMWSPNWNAGNPTWSTFNGDLSFKTFMGGSITSVVGNNDFSVGGNVHAHTIQNLTIQKDAYYQSISNSTAANYHPGLADPPPKVFPISDANIADWKNQAQLAGITSGDITNCVSVLNSQKIIGNVTFNSNCNVTVKSPIWITGNLTINSNNNLTLDSGYGDSSGIILVDGQVTLGSNNNLKGSGTGSSILMVLSTYDSRTNGNTAIAVTNTGNSGVFYAATGIIQPGNKNQYKELSGWGISLINNSELNYETGLSSTLFTSGPSGSYSLVKGTYQVR